MSQTIASQALGIGSGDPNPALGQLEQHLLALGAVDRNVIVSGARLGYAIGKIENSSGLARQGLCESHHSLAMHIASGQLPAQVSTPYMHEFAMQAAYYLARTSEEALNTLLAIASEHSHTLIDRDFGR